MAIVCMVIMTVKTVLFTCRGVRARSDQNKETNECAKPKEDQWLSLVSQGRPTHESARTNAEKD